jgi:DNA-binding MarR family transcriptional regulator
MATGDDREGSAIPLPALFSEAKDVTVAALHRRLEEEGFEGMRFSHGAVFRFIDVEGSRLTTLAARSGLTKQALGEVVIDLERHGYVERTADPQDNRAKIIRLTGRGVKAQEAAARILADIERRWARHVGEARVTGMRATLEEIIRFEKARDGGGST